MASVVEATPTRRSQAERVETMRNRILDAAVTCLTEQGYAGLSTNEVVRRAAVSRGALTHHFATREALVLATAERLIAAREADARAQFAVLTPDQLTIDKALDVLWSTFEGPTFGALVELVVAGRTDPGLRRALTTAPQRVVDVVLANFTELFPSHARLWFVEDAVRGVIAMYTGLAVQTMADGDVAGRQRQVRELFKQALKIVTSKESA